jgi:hypothetical protein
VGEEEEAGPFLYLEGRDAPVPKKTNSKSFAISGATYGRVIKFFVVSSGFSSVSEVVVVVLNGIWIVAPEFVSPHVVRVMAHVVLVVAHVVLVVAHVALVPGEIRVWADPSEVPGAGGSVGEGNRGRLDKGTGSPAAIFLKFSFTSWTMEFNSELSLKILKTSSGTKGAMMLFGSNPNYNYKMRGGGAEGRRGGGEEGGGEEGGGEEGGEEGRREGKTNEKEMRSTRERREKKT